VANKSLQMNFGNSRKLAVDFVVFDKIIKDRGSVYAVSLGRVGGRDDLKKFLKQVHNYNKKFRHATHHSYAARISKDEAVYETKGDDGETGAGMVILRIMQKQNFVNTAVCVTRWFGGVKLQGDRFKHLQNATLYGLDKSKEESIT